MRTSQIEPSSAAPTPHSGIPMPKSTPKLRGPNAKPPGSPNVKRSNLPKPSKGGAEQEPAKTPPLPRASPVIKTEEEEEKPMSFAVRQHPFISFLSSYHSFFLLRIPILYTCTHACHICVHVHVKCPRAYL